MTTAELMKAMENGEITGEAVINFAREQAKAIDAQLATAQKVSMRWKRAPVTP